jgi:hypothetical protein
MRIATFNVNGINGRLPVLLRWLAKTEPDVVCLQELNPSLLGYTVRVGVVPVNTKASGGGDMGVGSGQRRSHAPGRLRPADLRRAFAHGSPLVFLSALLRKR